MIRSKPPKPKTCKVCFNTFTPFTSLLKAKVCGPTCAQSLALSVRLKEEKRQAVKERAADRKKREALKTRSDYIKEAQREFNRYIRLRDSAKPCICCQQPLASGEVGGAYDAGHYRSVGSAPHLRFDERNCHAQTKKCNRYGAGRAVDYRAGLVRRYGVAFVEQLEADQEPRHYSIDDLKAIKAKYRALANQLAKEIA